MLSPRQISRFFAILLYKNFLLVTFAHATIMQMEELYNSSTGQTLLLASDFHYYLPAIDAQQAADLVNGLPTNSNIHLISEFHARTPFFQFSFEDDIVWRVTPQDQLILSLLYYAAKYHGICVHDIDFRDANANLSTVFRISKKHYTLDTALAYMENSENNQRLYDLVHTCLQESSAIMEYHIQPCIKKLQIHEQDHGYLFVMNKLLEEYTQAYKLFQNCFQPYRNEACKHFVRTFFQQVYSYEDEDTCMYDALKHADNKLLDLCIFKQLYELRHARVLIVHAGALHIRLIEPYLSSIGFISVSKKICSNDAFFEKVTLSLSNDERTAALETLDGHDARVVNIQNFLAACKTLS